MNGAWWETLLAPCVSMVLAGVVAYGTAQYSSGAQDTVVRQNTKRSEENTKAIKELADDVQVVKETTARLDERTKLILEEIRRESRQRR